jgi:methionyl-tRNA synthetase
MLYPVMPGKMAELRATLGLPREEPDFGSLSRWGGLEAGLRVRVSEGLFPRARAGAEEEEQTGDKAGAAKAAGGKAGASGQAPAPDKADAAADGIVSIEDFQKLKLRVARVISAERVEGADKLLKLQIDAGDGPRQIVAGVARHYSPEQVVGRQIVIVSNLKPARIRGIESRGMLLAASSGEALRLVSVDGDVAPGSAVK